MFYLDQKATVFIIKNSQTLETLVIIVFLKNFKKSEKKMADKIAVVILAAGKGTRMNLETPKPLVPLCGKTMIDFSLMCADSACHNLNLDAHYKVITGYGKEEVESYLLKTDKKNIEFVWQKEQRGTGDAVKSYTDQVKNLNDYTHTVVMCADTPLLKSEYLMKLIEKSLTTNSDAVVATFKVDQPAGYGRIVEKGSAFSIIEQKDASEEQKKINEVNSGLYCFKTSYLKEFINTLSSNNASGEFYLTDLFQPERNVHKECFDDALSFQGVNDLVQLESSALELYRRKTEMLQLSGVRFIDSKTNYIDWDVEIGAGSLIYPSVAIEGKTKIAKSCTIERGSIVKNTILSQNVVIRSYTVIESSKIGEGSQIGPFARIRPETILAKKVKIGNFVETKKAQLEDGVSVSHLSYLGDAEIGENTNIGCGFITCNYDGESKHLTKIGKNCFIGSDTQAIAPIEIGDSAYVGSGSTLNQNVPSGAFAIARGKQATKEGMAKRFLKGKWNPNK